MATVGSYLRIIAGAVLQMPSAQACIVRGDFKLLMLWNVGMITKSILRK